MNTIAKPQGNGEDSNILLWTFTYRQKRCSNLRQYGTQYNHEREHLITFWPPRTTYIANFHITVLKQL